jgi:hypothetical protein
MHKTNVTAPMGRLILVMEKQLTDASKGKLKNLLEQYWKNDEITWVSGLTRASAFEAGKNGEMFYNRDFIKPEEAVNLLPWREVWLLADGKVWKLNDSESCH